MFTPEGLQTPRPRPPALLRRSPSKSLALNSDGAPPPPYMLEFPSLHQGADCDTSDPVAATAKMMGIQLEEEVELSPTTVAEVSQKSREELTNLFLQAEKIIRARETELSLAANLGKTLLETNEALKLRHDALLSRLPVMQSQTSKSAAKPKSSQSDPWTTDEDVPTSATHSRASSISIVGSACSSPTHTRTNSINDTLAHRGHARRISASPSALLALSETNAELIAELTLLRSSTDSAQIEGARRLRKLEREIGGLKAELDASQRTNAELEERVKEQIYDERKRDRDERLRRLRLTEDAQDQESEENVRDFAPQGQGVETWDSIATPRMARTNPQRIDTDITVDSESEEPHSAYDASVSSASSSHYSSITPGEYAVVAQLYRKVEELQVANAELGARNRVVHERLARAERDALEINRVYDEIGEEIGAEADAELSDARGGSTGTLRGMKSPSPSLRGPRTARSVTPRPGSWSYRSKNRAGLPNTFLEETPPKKKGTGIGVGTRVLGNKQMYKGTHTVKSRKPLTDTLFAPPFVQDDPGSTPSIILVPSTSPRRTKGKGKARPGSLLSRPSSPFDAFGIRQDFSDSSRGSSRTGLRARSSSSSSYLSTSSYASLARYAGRRRPRRSLGSELGVEFGADWGGGDPDLSRHSTFFDDESVRARSVAYRDSGAEEEGENDGEEEDPALAALRHALSPLNAGRFLEEDEHILPVGALRSSPGEAFQLVSHAVAVRPNRWLNADDGRARGPGRRGILMRYPFFAPHHPDAEDPWETTRYPDLEPGAEDENNRGSVHSRTCRRARALERMASTRRTSHGEDLITLVHASQVQPMESHESPRAGNVVDIIKRTSANALIDLWIFLQFVVVICTFLYTMTKRGPREVLGAPPLRRA